MPEQRRHAIVFPLLLILAGVALLLEQVGVWEIPWSSLWRLWPALLVLLGLDLILGRSRAGVIVLVVLMIGVTAAGLLYWAPRFEAGVARDTRRLTRPLEGAQNAEFRIEMGVGALNLAALEPRSEDLYIADVRYDPARTSLSADVSGQGGQVHVALRSAQRGWTFMTPRLAESWDVQLSPRIPLRLDIASGVSRSRIDLTGLELERLDLRGGLGEIEARLSERGAYQARVSGGMGALTVIVPEGAEARLRVDGGLGAVNVSSRFERQGSYYVTPGYRSGEAIEIVINGGVGVLSVR